MWKRDKRAKGDAQTESCEVPCPRRQGGSWSEPSTDPRCLSSKYCPVTTTPHWWFLLSKLYFYSSSERHEQRDVNKPKKCVFLQILLVAAFMKMIFFRTFLKPWIFLQMFLQSQMITLTFVLLTGIKRLVNTDNTSWFFFLPNTLFYK